MNKPLVEGLCENCCYKGYMQQPYDNFENWRCTHLDTPCTWVSSCMMQDIEEGDSMNKRDKYTLHLAYKRFGADRAFIAVVGIADPANRGHDAPKTFKAITKTSGSSVEVEINAVMRAISLANRFDWDIDIYYGGTSYKWADGEWQCKKELTQNFKAYVDASRENHSILFKGKSDESIFKQMIQYIEDTERAERGFGI